jgi:glucokinase
VTHRYAIGLDLGGTRIKAACVSETGDVLARVTDATCEGDAAAWISTLRSLADRLARDAGTAPAGIGVSAPGLVANDRRSVAFMRGSLAGLQGLDFSHALDTRVDVLNDGHAALFGEAWTGAAAGCADVVMLTLGTGVGGAALANGRLQRGATGRAGHWGHVSLDLDGPPSFIGMPGSLEGAIGNCTLAARSEGRFTDTRALVEAHLSGDAHATRVWRRSVRALAVAIASIANSVDPERVVIGGGIARARAALFEPLDEELAQVEWRPLGRRVLVRPATLGDLAGAIGAARSALFPDPQ